MNNFDQAARLLGQAEESLEDTERAFQRQSWNMTIRRAQEVVELALKGLLSMMSIEYPKVHDVAPLFLQVARERQLPVEARQLEGVRQISDRLTRSRAPAFYAEESFTEEAAQQAIQDARKVLVLARGLGSFLKGPGT